MAVNWLTDSFMFQKLGENAVFLKYEDDDEIYVIPLKYIDTDADLRSLTPGEMFDASIAMWLAEERGMV